MSRLTYGGNFSLAIHERLSEPVRYEADVLYASAGRMLRIRPNMSNTSARNEPCPPLSLSYSYTDLRKCSPSSHI